jgi:glycyl-tRNA synthetase
MTQISVSMEDIVSLCKRRGFIFQGSEIYGGLAGTYDYGPLGTILKKRIEDLWWKHFVYSRVDMHALDSAILMNPRVWEASGHVGGFNDPLVSDAITKKRYRADHVLEDAAVDVTGMTMQQMGEKIAEMGLKSPDGNPYSAPQQFNMMFKTTSGSVDGADTTVYLRPETAQGMFVQFKNVMDSMRAKLPFGIAQVGRSFRNEIAPRDFIFRVRELEIMEFEYFIHEKTWKESFEMWRTQYHAWFKALGFESSDVQEVELSDADRAHYSKRTMDFYFKYPFGFKEIGGIAYRTDFDLKNHIEHSGEALVYHDPETNEKVLPHCIEPTFGLGRHVLAVIAKAYSEDELGGEKRIVLRFPKHLAPVRAAVFPLLKNKPELVEKAKEVFALLKNAYGHIQWDDNGNVGKRYRRQDEIGTPFCITVDFDTLGEEKPELKDTVTVRDRDTGVQVRVALSDLVAHIA